MKEIIPFSREMAHKWPSQVKTYPPILVALGWAFAYLILLPFLSIIILPLFTITLLIFYLFNLNVSGSQPLPPGQNRVSTFYSPELKDSYNFIMFIIFFLTTSIFGGLHCIAWHFQFLMQVELHMWQVLSVIVTFIPSAFLVMAVPMTLGGSAQESLASSRTFVGIFLWVVATFIYISSAVTLFLILFSYFPARLMLLIESFVLLRDLPPKALLEVDWHNFIPHI